MCAGAGQGILEISAETEIRQLAIYNIHGNLIRKINVDARRVSFNFTSLAKGIYIIKLTGNGWTEFRKYER
jgi:urate oxidase